MKKLILFLTIVSISLLSCKKDKDEDPPPTPTPPVVGEFDYIKAGAKWTYNTFDTDPNHQGITVEESHEIKTKDTDGWCTVEWKIAPVFVQQIEWFSDNTMFSNQAQKQSQMRFPLIKSNPVLNDTYSITYSSNNGPVTNTRVVKSLTESITVPAGSYTNCVKIHETTSEDTVYYKDYWVAKNIGVVRMEGTTKEDFPVIIIQELKTKQ
jgi:hypothetical protein